MAEPFSTNMYNSEQVIQWATAYLANYDYTLCGPVEPVRIMPWSQVYRVLTADGYIYLKQMSPPFAIEAKLIKYLSKRFNGALPYVIALNSDIYCFLMSDAGIPLRGVLGNNYQIELTCKALDTYSGIQRGSTKEIDTLIDLGVPDWRLTKLPLLYQDLLSKRALLEQDGLTPCEIEKLQQLHSKFADLCDQLSHYKIPETIEHSDFHDNNILLKDNYLRINDWGESTISHPFFSLVSFLKSAGCKHNITEMSDEYSEMQDRYLNNWLVFEPKHRLLKALELAQRIGPIKFALSFYRVTLCSGMDQLSQYKGIIKEALQSFIQTESS